MKNLEMIVEMKNGQLAIDFDALELITSEEFVATIMNEILVNKKHITSGKVKEYGNTISFYLMTDFGRMYVFNYNRRFNEFHTDVYNSTDVKIFIEMSGGRVV